MGAISKSVQFETQRVSKNKVLGTSGMPSFDGLEEGMAKEVNNVEMTQMKIKDGIALLLQGLSFSEAETLIFQFLTELKRKAVITISS